MSKKGLGKKYRGEPNIVEEYKIGETVIKIADDAYRDRTPEEIQQTLNNIKNILMEIYVVDAMKANAAVVHE